MDGRDIGTVVLPQAQVKIFLTASPEIRAERRYKELIEKGSEVDYQSVLDDIVKGIIMIRIGRSRRSSPQRTACCLTPRVSLSMNPSQR